MIKSRTLSRLLSGAIVLAAIAIYLLRSPIQDSQKHENGGIHSHSSLKEEDFEIEHNLALRFSKSISFQSLTPGQQESLIYQASELLILYRDAYDLNSIEALMRTWGGELRDPAARESLIEFWPGIDSPDRIVSIDASQATLEADQIIGVRDGWPIRQIPNRISGLTSSELRVSAFSFGNAPEPNSSTLIGVTFPVQYADGDHAMIALWFQWFASQERWIPSRLEFQRDGRPFRGAPLF